VNNQDRERRAFELFLQAIERPAEERSAFLRAECGDDPDLCREVDALLHADDGFVAGDPLPSILRGSGVADVMGQPLGVRDVDAEDGVGSSLREMETPEQVGPYRLLRKVGEGGMGVVYEAEQQQPVRRKVSLKLIKWGMDTKEVIARFESERQALALMNHPTIASVYDAGATEQGRPYFAMEFIHGIPVTEYCDKHRLTIPERLELVIQVCEGVQHAHQKGIIHRDLKPPNVLVTVQDGRPVPKIIDFGVAKATSQRLTEHTIYTQMGQLVGTPAYMSPEQAEMTNLDVDTRTDVYSLGVLLYELLVGAQPFDAGELRKTPLSEIQRRLREVEPPRPSTKVGTLGKEAVKSAGNRRLDEKTLVRQLRGDLDWITMKALEKDRTRRYDTAASLATDIKRYLRHEPILAGPPSASYRFRKFARRNRVPLAFVGTVFLLFTLALVESNRQGTKVRRARDEAELVIASLEDLLASADPNKRGRDATLREILDDAASTMGKRFQGQPRVEARLRFTVGKTFEALGEYDKAESNLRRAIDVGERELGPEHPETLRSKVELANVHREQARYDESEALLRETLAIRRRVLGPEHPQTLETMTSLVSILVYQKRAAEAEVLGRETLRLNRRVLGDDNLQTLISMHYLARAIQDQGRLAEAETLFKETIDIKRRALGDDHLETLKSMSDLANVYSSQGRIGEAHALYLKTLERQRRVLGLGHSHTLITMNNLGLSYLTQRRYAEAEAVLRETVEQERRVRGEKHPYTLETQYNLACVMARAGRRKEALDTLHQIVENGFVGAYIAGDSDLASLHGDPGFDAMVAEVQKRTKAR
jgi:serine/threonine protein kinase